MNSAPPFVSYSQNLEDVMLFRALGHIERGFYVDVGAAHPTYSSVTKAFYDRGWNGINVEPSAQYFPILEKERERDANFDCAISSTEGELEFWEVAETGNSTLDPKFGQKYIDEGLSVTKRIVTCRRLSSLTQDIPTDEVHFLKIDAEESERQVLESADFSEFRPWIIVIEATYPNSPEPSHEGWEELILTNQYRFVFFDGLNRFYIAAEHPELAEAFSRPVCVFDNYITLNEHMLLEERHHLRASLAQVEEEKARRDKVFESLSRPLTDEEIPVANPSAEPDEQLRELCGKMKEIIRERDAEIVEMAEMNLELMKRIPKPSGFSRALRTLLKPEGGKSTMSPEELEEKISKLRLEIKQRFQAADEVWLRE